MTVERFTLIIRLIPILPDGQPAEPIPDFPDEAREVLAPTAQLYESAGCHEPWLGYLALEGERCVGTCAFKSPPVDGRAEIAYYTFPGQEGRGVATAMAGLLVRLAHAADPEIRLFAHTLPERNASTRVLEKNGFRMAREMEHPEDGRVWEWELLAVDEAHP